MRTFNHTKSLQPPKPHFLRSLPTSHFSNPYAMGLLTLSLSILLAIPHLVSAQGHSRRLFVLVVNGTNADKGWRWERIPDGRRVEWEPVPDGKTAIDWERVRLPDNKIAVDADKFNGMNTETERTSYELLRQSHCLNQTRGLVHFRDFPDEGLGRTYLISTPWTASYDIRLQTAFDSNEFIALDLPTPEQSCGWLFIDSFKSKGVYRG